MLYSPQIQSLKRFLHLFVSCLNKWLCILYLDIKVQTKRISVFYFHRALVCHDFFPSYWLRWTSNCWNRFKTGNTCSITSKYTWLATWVQPFTSCPILFFWLLQASMTTHTRTHRMQTPVCTFHSQATFKTAFLWSWISLYHPWSSCSILSYLPWTWCSQLLPN